MLISDIGESVNNEALQCVTDAIQCCARARVGEWYFPSGARVPIRMQALTFYRNRGDDGTVNLNRLGNTDRETTSPTGLYCCSIPSASGIDQLVCIYVGELTHRLRAIIIIVSEMSCIHVVGVEIISSGSTTAGQKYTLACHVSSTLLNATFYWIKTLVSDENTTLTNKSTMISTMSQLLFSPLKTSDGGLYVCKVRLGDVLAVGNFSVIVQSKYTYNLVIQH